MTTLLTDATTKDLVNELKYREGVEFIMVDVEEKGKVVVYNKLDVSIYMMKCQGPEIILRVID
jgi:hypothetical protein